jgi:SAM-dependent methyltransferase
MKGAAGLDRHDLYERCVQTPADLVPILRAIHGGEPGVLGEDFCGTAAVSAEWVRRVKGGRAIAVDHDASVLARAPRRPGIEIVAGDVVRDTSPGLHDADVVYAGNFSIGEWHTRAALLAYLRHVRSRLGAGGVFVCDLYGGETAFLLGTVEREHPGPAGRSIRYTWEQREADPLTGMVVNVVHFTVLRGEDVEQELHDAFVYRWRLWGVPELRDAMVEAGFVSTAVYPRRPEALEDTGAAHVEPIEDPGLLEDSFDILVAARR